MCFYLSLDRNSHLCSALRNETLCFYHLFPSISHVDHTVSSEEKRREWKSISQKYYRKAVDTNCSSSIRSHRIIVHQPIQKKLIVFTSLFRLCISHSLHTIPFTTAQVLCSNRKLLPPSRTHWLCDVRRTHDTIPFCYPLAIGIMRVVFYYIVVWCASAYCVARTVQPNIDMICLRHKDG